MVTRERPSTYIAEGPRQCSAGPRGEAPVTPGCAWECLVRPGGDRRARRFARARAQHCARHSPALPGVAWRYLVCLARGVAAACVSAHSAASGMQNRGKMGSGKGRKS